MENFDVQAEGDSENGTARGAESCQAADLRALLGTIVEQLTEADRRQSDTLEQMQQRLSVIGSEAEAIRPNVPTNFAGAFEQIEAGMRELARRLSSDGVSPVQEEDNSGGNLHLESKSEPKGYENEAAGPFALRSALAQNMSKSVSPRTTGVDTFDIIDTSLPGNEDEPWNEESAEALSNLYQSGSGSFSTPSVGSEGEIENEYIPTADSKLDFSWLEGRLADINRRIDSALGELNLDQNFFAMTQRLDGLEGQIAQAIEGLNAGIGQGDGTSVEATFHELSTVLEGCANQLVRLDEIERQIGSLAERIDALHGIAGEQSGEQSGTGNLSEDQALAIARMTAEEVSHYLDQQGPGENSPGELQEMRGLFESFMGERQRGEQHINDSISGLRDAIVQLLDRLEAFQTQSAQRVDYGIPHDAVAHDGETPFTTEEERTSYEGPVTEYVAEMQSRGTEPDPNGGDWHGDEPSASPAGGYGDYMSEEHSPSSYAEVNQDGWEDAPRETYADPGHADTGADYAPMHHGMDETAQAEVQMREELQHPAADIRQDFIADARRAKLKAQQATWTDAEGRSDESESGDDDEDGVALIRKRSRRARETEGNDEAESAPRRRPVSREYSTDRGDKEASAAPSRRVIGLALAAVLALAGLWYTFNGSNDPSSTERVTAGVPAGNAGSSGVANSGATDGNVFVPSAGPSTGSGQSDGAAEFEVNQNTPETRGEIVAGEIIVGQTSVPLAGMTIDSERPMDGASLAEASRRQSLANMSNRVGRAAAGMTNEVPTPVALVPQNEEQTVARSSRDDIEGKSSLNVSRRLEMPPATVGPYSLRLAAAKGDPSAEFEVGSRFSQGKGMEQDFKQAAKWYGRSASRGFAQSQYRLGTLFERGLGVKKDRQRAMVWYKRAAGKGNIKAMHNLAVMNTNPETGSPDYMAAAQWFEKASERGLSDSQFNLAVLYEFGLGVKKDINTAYRWLVLSARSGDGEAVSRRTAVGAKLAEEDRLAIEQRTRNWRPVATDPLANDERVAGEAWKKATHRG